MTPKQAPPLQHYFVDESGDGTLFDSKGRVILGREGCSSFFILGALAIENPDSVTSAMDALWSNIASDRYLNVIPSIKKRITNGFNDFHASKDPPEVRMEVFRLFLTMDIKLFAVVKDKQAVLNYVQSRIQTDDEYRYKPDELYNFTVRQLFPDKLHQSDEYLLHFAKRVDKARSHAITQALESARQRFLDDHDKPSHSVIKVDVAQSKLVRGLQAVDYFLWSLQRFYEKGEDRFLNYLWDKVRLVRDVDDKRRKPYGEYYSQRNPLTLAKIKNRRI